MTNNPQRCITCQETPTVMTCNGCQKTFCAKHSLEHRQQLAAQLDGLMNEHSSLQREFDRSANKHALFPRIDTWETDAIAKIRAAAEAARTQLRQIIDRHKQPLTTPYRDLAMSMRSSREVDNYSENELSRWTTHLKEIKFQLASSVQARLVESDWSVVKLITVQDASTAMNIPTSLTQDRFSKVIGSVTLDEDGLVAKHTSNDWNYEYVLGEQRYAEGRHTILFRIEQCGTPYNIFFGCISSSAIQSRISVNAPSTAGWFGFNQVYRHGTRSGNPIVHRYNSNEIGADDVLYLTFDCEKKQLELFHEDTNKRHTIGVDVENAPLPWQLLMMLTDKDDCVRIMSSPKEYSSGKT